MQITKDRTRELVTEFGGDAKNTGTSEVQIAILTERVNYLTEHLKTHLKDHHGRMGLLRIVGQRRSLLDHMIKTDVEGYRSLIKKLNIRK